MAQSSFFLPSLRARQMIEQGYVGNVVSFRAEYLHAGSVDPGKMMGWKQEKRFGGGVINDLASHILDLMDHLIGPFESVFAENRILYPERPDREGKMTPVEVEDQAILLLRCANGSSGITVGKINTLLGQLVYMGIFMKTRPYRRMRFVSPQCGSPAPYNPHPWPPSPSTSSGSVNHGYYRSDLRSFVLLLCFP